VDMWPRLSVLCCWMQAGPFNELTFRPRSPTKCWNKSQSLEELFSREAKARCGIQWLYDSCYTGLCGSMSVNTSLTYFLSGMIRLSKSAQQRQYWIRLSHISVVTEWLVRYLTMPYQMQKL
jgi:hypothetical protein